MIKHIMQGILASFAVFVGFVGLFTKEGFAGSSLGWIFVCFSGLIAGIVAGVVAVQVDRFFPSRFMKKYGGALVGALLVVGLILRSL